MTDEREATLTTQFGDHYKMEVKTDGARHYVVVTCNGAIIAATINENIPRGFVYEPPEYTRIEERKRVGDLIRQHILPLAEKQERKTPE